MVEIEDLQVCCKVGDLVRYGESGNDRRMEKKMEVAELLMARWMLGVTLKDRVRNEYIWETEKIRRIMEKLMGERLRWFWHVKNDERGQEGGCGWIVE